MRNPTVVIVLLVLFGLVPIGLCGAMLASLVPAGLGRSIGLAIVVLLSPFAVAGGLMIVGAAMFNRTQSAGRIFATTGAAIVAVGAAILAAMWSDRIGRCVEDSSFCTDRVVEGVGLLVYSIAHIGLIALVWRARRGELSSVA